MAKSKAGAKKSVAKQAANVKKKPKSSRTAAKDKATEKSAAQNTAAVVDEKELPPAPEPSGCTQFVCEQIAQALPKICRLLLNEALAGKTQAARTAALKLLWQMALLDKQAGKSAGDGGKGGSKGAAAEREFARRMLAEFRNR